MWSNLSQVPLARIERAPTRLHGAPVVVQETGNSLKLLAGDDLVQQASDLGEEAVAGVILEEGIDPEPALTILRAGRLPATYAEQLAGVKAVLHAGIDARAIADAVGEPVAKVRNLLVLDTLSPALLAVLDAGGKLTLSTAQRAARLPAAAQQRLAEILERDGRLRAADVDALADDTGNRLPDRMFQTVWPVQALSILFRVEQCVPQGHPVCANLQELRAALEKEEAALRQN